MLDPIKDVRIGITSAWLIVLTPLAACALGIILGGLAATGDLWPPNGEAMVFLIPLPILGIIMDILTTWFFVFLLLDVGLLIWFFLSEERRLEAAAGLCLSVIINTYLLAPLDQWSLIRLPFAVAVVAWLYCALRFGPMWLYQRRYRKTNWTRLPGGDAEKR